MLLRAAGDHRNNVRDVQLGTLFDRPLHAIELEDRQQQGDGNGGLQLQRLAQGKLHAVVGNAGYGGAPDLIAARDLELLAHFRSQSA